ncbi:hypothetical protein PIB30_034228 [Stylosanthes scabra]|uniref:Uncharacterized protein n=1 Tax=Stylosanthes scabra TaxID=79078 RepID=A0ABU6UBG4_9FABA|nr:hypothetical protein [Stylosanthes scabra]
MTTCYLRDVSPKDRLVALVIPQAGNLRFSPPSSYTTHAGSLLSSNFLHNETDCTLLPMTGCIPQFIDISGSVGSVPPHSPPPSDEEPSAETYDPAAELVGDPDELYVAELVPYEAPKAYYSDTSSSGSVSLGYGSASSGSASDGASNDDLVNRYFAGTFPPP